MTSAYKFEKDKEYDIKIEFYETVGNVWFKLVWNVNVENKWKNERSVNLDGEGFFKVAKGSKFDVETSAGTVSVVGTQFNVKNRKDDMSSNRI